MSLEMTSAKACLGCRPFLHLLLHITIICYCTNKIYGDEHISRRGTYIGCYHEKIDLYKTSIFAGNVVGCLEMCESLYFRYAVLSSNDKCSCSNDLDAEELEESICNARCSRSKSEYCGGVDAQSYYDTGLRASGPPTHLGVINKTDTTMTLRWEDPQQVNLVTNFVIKAIVMKSFANYPLFPQPEWTVQSTERQFEMINLHPGTQYNISVVSMCDRIECGAAFVIEETIIGMPDPPPEEPKIVKESEATITIDINPGFNNNGPISYYRVVVMFIDDEISQIFDESLLADYQRSLEDAIPYYITAELKYQNVTRRFMVGDKRFYRGYYNAPLPSNRHVHICLGIISNWNGVTKIKYAMASHDQHTRGKAFLDMDDSQSSIIALSIACIIFGILLIGSIFAYCYLRLKTSNRRERLSDAHELSLQGPMVAVENNGFVADESVQASFKSQLNTLVEGLENSQKFARNALRLDIDDILVKGNYGEAVSGRLYVNTDSYDCQVHVVSDDMESQDQTAFLKEFDQLIRLMPHDKFLYFFGISASPEWFYIIFERIPTTLKRKLIESRIPQSTDNFRFSAVSEESVLQWVYDIAVAMEYLEANKVVHKKLCSYNVLVTQQNQIKLSLFGPTALGDEGKEIEISRWMSPEVLRFQHHSTKSDVWSFGCLAWECCTLGATLYANIAALDLLPRIRNGLRPDQAAFISKDLHQLLIYCWQLEPSERPDFEEIAFNVRQLLMSPRHALSFDRRENIFIPYYLPLLEIKN